MMAYALTSIFAGIFDVKHYFHLQVGATQAVVLLRINLLSNLVCSSPVTPLSGIVAHPLVPEVG